MKARILLVDDHEIVRSGLKFLLEKQQGWELCGEAQNGEEAVQKAATLKPDLVVMDISMPVMNGFEAARQILKSNPKIKVIILSMHDSPMVAKEAKNAGASAYLVKTTNTPELVNTVRRVLQQDSQSEKYA